MSKTFQIQNGDVLMSSATSRPFYLADRDKLTQDLFEACRISVQPNGFGFGLDDIIGEVADALTIRTDLSNQIRDGIENMRRLQQLYQFDQRPDTERISRLVRVNVFGLQPDGSGKATKTAYGFRFDILTAAGDQPLGSTGLVLV